MRIVKSGLEVTSLDDWFRLAPPKKGALQWKDGRSAKELARRWLVGFPPEVRDTLASHELTFGFVPDVVIPEHPTVLDEFLRGPREHDLLVTGMAGDRRVLMSIEGKVDESFSESIGQKVAAASPSSDQPERVRRIALALFGPRPLQELVSLRYQLFSAVAGTLIEAHERRSNIAVFLVHEFITNLANERLVAQNGIDLNRFVSVLGGGAEFFVEPGTLVGPFKVPGYAAVPPGIPLLIGKSHIDLT